MPLLHWPLGVVPYRLHRSLGVVPSPLQVVYRGVLPPLHWSLGVVPFVLHWSLGVVPSPLQMLRGVLPPLHRPLGVVPYILQLSLGVLPPHYYDDNMVGGSHISLQAVSSGRCVTVPGVSSTDYPWLGGVSMSPHPPCPMWRY